MRVILAIFVAWLALCTIGLVYLRYFPPLVTAMQLQRWIQYGDPPGSRSGFVPLKTLGPNLPRAVIAAEDARFYQHNGIDIDSLRRAVEDNLRRGRLWRGGSTITQQLVKNLFLTTYGSFVRKILEVPLSLLAELILVGGTWVFSPEAQTAGSDGFHLAGEITNAHALGLVLYTKYVYLFQAAGLILLVAMIGAIVLTFRAREGVRRQKIGAQLARRSEEAIELRKVKSREGV